MAYENVVGTIPGVVAGADYSSSGQYKAVKFDSTAGEIKVVSATTDPAIGILQDNPKSGQSALVANLGISKALAGTSASWVAGGPVGWNSTGQVVPVTASATRRHFGVYLKHEASVAINQLISVSLVGGALVN